MEDNFNKEADSQSLAAVIREVRSGLINVVRSDLALAVTEMKETTQQLKSDLVQVGVFGIVAILGILPLMGFLVIGLGRILGDNYWLSSLIVAVLCFTVGGGLAYRALTQMKKHDSSLPHTRRTLDQERAAVERKIHTLSATAKTTANKGRVA